MKNTVFSIVQLIGTSIALLLLACCVPPHPDRADCPLQKGIVERIIVPDSGTGDVSFYLKDVDGFFYINRGIQQKLPVSDWQRSLPGKEVTIARYKGYSHICEIRFDDSVLYSEFE